MTLKTSTSETKTRIAKLGNAARYKNFLEKREQRLLNEKFENLNNKEKRLRILREQNNSCSICMLNEWNNKPIPLELDHINGDRLNNERTNLRFICPNCHAQTPTYKIGNNKAQGKKYYSDEEIIESLKNSTSGYIAMKSLGMNPHGGNYTRIRKIIKQYDLKLNYTV